MNLLTETLEDIKRSGHEVCDIIFIGSVESGHSCTWDEFAVMADREYDDGYGAQEVAMDLIIAFSDKTTMWRHEYDGSECWEYSKPFVMPIEQKPIKHLFVDDIDRVGWCNLSELNSGEENE